MPYIERDDGVRFVIPSYRDTLVAKQKSQLKNEILTLCESYGNFIAMQKKGISQYEVAFSPDTGYLLGESIWHYFKRPLDMIYCEAIPNTTEAILVIVKAGSVYLDGSFPMDIIPEELVIFLTQENNFEIYVYGDVPISETPEEGKFSFEGKSVKSFIVLDKPVFSTLPLLTIYQLRLVEQVLKEHKIGVFPTRQLIFGLVGLGLIWMLYSYLTTPKEEVVAPALKVEESPYKEFVASLHSPAPQTQINSLVNEIKILLTMPGWTIRSIDYANGVLTIGVMSGGSTVQDLFRWAEKNDFPVTVKPEGVFLTKNLTFTSRPDPNRIYPIKEVIGVLNDRLADVYPGNNITLGQFINKGVFTSVPVTITLSAVSLSVLVLIADQLKDLPLVLTSFKVNVDSINNLTGTMTLDALGS